MRVNLYSEELTRRIEIVEKSTEAGDFVGVRFYIETPVTIRNQHNMTQIVRGPYEKVDGDDDSSAVTFWTKRADCGALKELFRSAVLELGQWLDGEGAS